MGSSMYRLKENRPGRCERESDERRKGEMCSKKKRGGGQGVGKRKVISGDLLLQRCIGVCAADRSVMDSKMSQAPLHISVPRAKDAGSSQAIH